MAFLKLLSVILWFPRRQLGPYSECSHKPITVYSTNRKELYNKLETKFEGKDLHYGHCRQLWENNYEVYVYIKPFSFWTDRGNSRSFLENWGLSLNPFNRSFCFFPTSLEHSKPYKLTLLNYNDELLPEPPFTLNVIKVRTAYIDSIKLYNFLFLDIQFPLDNLDELFIEKLFNRNYN